MKTAREFVQDLFDATIDIIPMSLETARHDLDSFKKEGWEIPEDLDAETFCEFWNELVNW